MSRVEEIEQAIDRLTQDEFQRISRWFHEKEQAHWDDRLDKDSSSGHLDFLFDEADEKADALSPWPPTS